MPRTRSLMWSELKIGMMAVAAMVIAAVLILALSGEGGFFWQRYRLKARFPNAGGVKSGSPVRVAGVEVGPCDDKRPRSSLRPFLDGKDQRRRLATGEDIRQGVAVVLRARPHGARTRIDIGTALEKRSDRFRMIGFRGPH